MVNLRRVSNNSNGELKTASPWRNIGLLCMFIFFVAIKGAGPDEGGVDETADLPLAFLALKEWALGLLIIVFAIQLRYIRRLHFGGLSIFSASWFSMLFFYYLRMYIDEPEMLSKLVVSFLIYFWTASYVLMLASEVEFHKENIIDVVYYSIVWFSLVYCILSAIMLFQGFGVLSFSGRFVGFTDHPNFVGMAASVSLSVSLFEALNGGKFYRWLGVVCFVCALYILLGSASRTAMSAGFIGVSCVIFRWLQINRSVGAKELVVGVVLVLMFLSTAINEIGSTIGLDASIDRLQYADNTRKDVWDALFLQISENPFFGVGTAVVASESSFLRITAASGLLVGFWFLINLIVVVVCSIRNAMAQGYRGDIILILLLQIIIGSFAEGYLAEFLGLMPVLFVLLVASLDVSKKTGMNQ